MARLFSSITAIGLIVLGSIHCLSAQTIDSATDTRTPATSAPNVTGIQHIIWIWFENKENSDISTAPYFSSFAAGNLNFTNFYAITHPSQPNYLNAFSGSNQGVPTNDHSSFPASADNLAKQLLAAGKSWRVYVQNYPGNCFDGDSNFGGTDGPGVGGQYVRRHNPAISFESVRLNPAECANIQPLANFDPTVNFAFVTPNMTNDMHDGTIEQGDAFLQAFVPLVTASPDWDHTLLIVSFDEGTTGVNGGGHIYTAAAAPWLAHANVATTYNHHSVLRTIEEVFGLPFLGGAATATTMTELLPPTPTASPSPTLSPSPTPAPTQTPSPPTPTPTPTPMPVCTPLPPATQGFGDITTLVPAGWFMQNNSQPGPGVTGWFQGNSSVFPAQGGPGSSYIATNTNNGTGVSTLSNWLLSPKMIMGDGAGLIFYTRTVSAPMFPDRLQVRLSTSGASTNVGATATDVGDFTTLLLDINPTYSTSGYPTQWTAYQVILHDMSFPFTGRFAFRYFVENGGPSGANSDYIGIDSIVIGPGCGGGFFGTPTPSPTTPTPTPGPTVSISGMIDYCSSSSVAPVSGVTMTLTGSMRSITLTDSSGSYSFPSVPSGGDYLVTPTRLALNPGSTGIDTVDVIAVQRHYLNIALLPAGCRLRAADVNLDGSIDTVDVVAIQRFFLGRSSGVANVGKYEFSPPARSYLNVVSNLPDQNYDALIFGDVASPFANLADRPSQQ